MMRAEFHGNPAGEDPIKNFEDFKIPNKIGVFEHYRLPKALLDHEYNYPVCRDTMGIRWPGYWFGRKFVYVKEMEPELIVPDLTDFQLKPYVSYRTEEVQTKPFTAKELFDRTYASQVESAFRQDNVETFDVPPEKIDEARLKALQTGSDLFEDRPLDGVRAPIEYTVDI
jgi:large subunit ribosomal protein L41